MKISLLSVLVLLSLSQDTRAREKKVNLIGPINIRMIQGKGGCSIRELEGYGSKYSTHVCSL